MVMTWFFFAFIVAVSEALKDVVGKKTLQITNEYVVTWGWMTFPVPFLLIAVWIQGVPELGKHFWIAWAGALLVVLSSFTLYIKAIKASDLSLTLPMITFTPLFLLITSPLMVGEFPGPLGLVGILCIVTGSYVLNIREKNKGVLAPYRALLSERGPQFMLIVAFIWSIGANLDKIGVRNSSSFFWVCSIYLGTAVIMTPVMVWKTRNVRDITTPLPRLLLMGLIMAIGSMSQMTAITMTLVPYVIAVKRMSIVLGVLLGYVLFKESGFRERFVGVVIMVVGMVCITLS